MPTSPTSIRTLPLLAVALTIVLATTGCGTSSPDTSRGRQLFITKCGSCHMLAQAATTGTQGPDLDAAFAAARSAGEDSDTIEGIVKAQIEFPRPAGNPPSPTVTMPSNLVEGQARDDVAAYVGSVAGVPGAAPPKVPGGPGAQVFANNGCGGCHALSAANSGGTVGPNLDEALSGQSAALIRESIVAPNDKITKGYPSSVMPQNFEQVIPPDQLEQLVDFLVTSTGGGKGGKAGKGGGKK